jgi:DNA-binding response OmpR family regulator
MKVLIADDEPVTCRLLQWFLERWGFETVVVHDGALAEWMLQREDAPRLALVDWMMPGLDGIEICRRLRKRAEGPYIYTILVTSKARKEDAIEGLEAGADDYVTKPFDPDELRARLKAGRRIVDVVEDLRGKARAAAPEIT